MKKKRRGFERKKYKRDDALFLISCEDTCASVQYFEGMKDRYLTKKVLKRVKLLPFGSEGRAGSPQHVLDRLKEYRNTHDIFDFDEFWLALDTDHWIKGSHRRSYRRVCAEALGQGVQLANSNPSFESWLLLHTEFPKNAMASADDVIVRLREIHGQYNKRNIVLDDFLPNIMTAIDLAKANDPSPGEYWPDKFGSHVYRIFDALHIEVLH